MSDIKLFRIGTTNVEEIEGYSVALEKTLQRQIEQHLETFLGVRFLASEHSTGTKHAGRIDTLGIDENTCPVVIEYKRSLNENVITQGLYYLDWLMDHKAEFQLLVQKKFGAELAEQIEWSTPRLMCIAGDFTKYDAYAVQQIPRNIDLIRYRKYGDDLLLFEQVNAVSVEPIEEQRFKRADITIKTERAETTTVYKTFSQYLEQSPLELRDRFASLQSYITSLGDDVQEKTLKFYTAFKRMKNFCCAEVHPKSNTLLIYLKIDPSTITLETDFTRDVSNIGHFGTGDLEVSIRSAKDLEKAKALIALSYEAS